MFYDIVGNELKVGAIVSVPYWDDRTVMLGVIKHLNTNYDEEYGPLHSVEVRVDGEPVIGAWRGSSITVLPESDAVMVRLRDFKPVEEEAYE